MENKFLNIVGIVTVVAAVAWANILPKEKVVNAGIKLENMNITFNPGDDFYAYANAGWQKHNPIPDDYSRYGAFEVLRNTNLERTRKIAENDNGEKLLKEEVTEEEIAEVISGWTGIPVSKLVETEREKLLKYCDLCQGKKSHSAKIYCNTTSTLLLQYAECSAFLFPQQ